jgi:hypothetical protein
MTFQPIPEITIHHREERNLSQQEFADALCERLPGVSKLRQEVNMWELGKQAPGYMFALLVFMRYTDWRGGGGHEGFKGLKPEYFGEEVKDV